LNQEAFLPGVKDAERRGARRRGLFLTVAKLVFDCDEQVCIVRDISETGALVQTFADISEDRLVALELSSGYRVEVQSAWKQGNRTGLAFSTSVDLHAFLARKQPNGRRQPRFRIQCAADVRSGLTNRSATVMDISQFGALIQCDQLLLIDEVVSLDLKFWRPIFAKVRWRRGSHFGLIFEETFLLEQLASLLISISSRRNLIAQPAQNEVLTHESGRR